VANVINKHSISYELAQKMASAAVAKATELGVTENVTIIGAMDYWDPTVTDGLARDREVILFDNAGVSSSSGEVPTTFERMGADAIAYR
jgi:hypothetical protein